MNSQQNHEMQLAIEHVSGAEEWNCPTCGRRLLISWQPSFKKIVLEGGDEFSIHRGGKGGLIMGGAQITRANDSDAKGDPELHEDTRLTPWETWMDKSDFDHLWDDEVE